MISPASQLAVVAAINQVATGTEQEEQLSRLGSQRTCQLEQNGFEVGRCNRSWVGGVSLVAGGVVPVVDLPTTTGPFVVFNGEPAGGKLLHIKHVSAFYASGTEGAAGFGIFAGVTPAPLATALTANDATNFKTQSTRGYGLVTAYVGVAKTIPAGTAWLMLDGEVTLAATVTGSARGVDVRHIGFIVAPGYAFVCGCLADTGTTAKYGFTVAMDALDGDLQ